MSVPVCWSYPVSLFLRIKRNVEIGAYFGQFITRNNYDYTSVVQPTSSRSSRHLSILAWKDIPKALSIVFADAGKDDATCGHVNTHSERFSGEKDFDKPSREEDFDYLCDASVRT